MSAAGKGASRSRGPSPRGRYRAGPTDMAGTRRERRSPPASKAAFHCPRGALFPRFHMGMRRCLKVTVSCSWFLRLNSAGGVPGKKCHQGGRVCLHHGMMGMSEHGMTVFTAPFRNMCAQVVCVQAVRCKVVGRHTMACGERAGVRCRHHTIADQGGTMPCTTIQLLRAAGHDGRPSPPGETRETW